MASGVDENNYSRCSVCLEDGRDNAARYYCLECEVCFCSECVKTHTILKALKTHQINDVDCPDSDLVGGETSVRGSDVSTERGDQSLRCPIHHGNIIDTFCKDHDEVCCGTCAVVKHRPCSTVSIAAASNDFKSSPDITKGQDALSKTLESAKQEKKKREDNLECIGKQKQELVEEVDNYEERMIVKIKELANTSREEIRSKYEELKTPLDDDVTSLNAVVTTATTYLNKLDETNDEEALFANVKACAIATRDGETLLQTMTTEWKERELVFDFDMFLEKAVDGMKSLDQIKNHVNVKEYKATYVKNVDVNHANSPIYDMCLMDCGDLIVTDYNNSKLKRFSSDLTYKDELALSYNPIAVCTTGRREVAVRTYDSKVHFVSVGESMQLTSSFTINANANGITYDVSAGEIFVGENNKISVYSDTGTLLRTYDNDANGEQIFSACGQITLSDNKRDIYVTDQNKGLIVLDARSGSLKMKVSVPGVSGTWPLCLLPGGVCLVGGQTSDVIVQIDREGKTIGNIIESKDGRTHTWCAVYDRERKRLLVGGNPSVISVYNISEN